MSTDVAPGLGGLASLRSVGALDLHVATASSWISLVPLGRLEEVRGDMTLDVQTSTAGLSALREVDGQIEIRELTGSRLELSGLTRADGLVVLEANDLINLGGLEALEELGRLELAYADVTDLVVPNLTTVTTLSLDHVSVGTLTGLPPMPRLEQLALVSVDAPDLDAFAGLETIEGDLTLYDVDGPTTLDGLADLREVGGNMQISYCSDLTDLSGLLGLERIGGDLEIFQLREVPPEHLAEIVAALTPIVDGDVITY